PVTVASGNGDEKHSRSHTPGIVGDAHNLPINRPFHAGRSQLLDQLFALHRVSPHCRRPGMMEATVVIGPDTAATGDDKGCTSEGIAKSCRTLSAISRTTGAAASPA